MKLFIEKMKASRNAFVLLLLVLTSTLYKYTDAVEVKCEPNVRIKRSCDLCACNSDGSTLTCNFFSCDKESYPPGTVIVTDNTVCTPGSYFAADCNNCRCSTDGGVELSCTRKLC